MQNTTEEVYSILCHHETEDGGLRHVLADCSNGIQHKISQWGEGYICNTCCELIKKACRLTVGENSICLQCKSSEELERFVNSRQICEHENANITKVTLSCLLSETGVNHELDLGEKAICSECEKKLIYKYQAQQQCKICSNKTKELLTNLKSSLANQQIRIIKKLLLTLAERKASEHFKQELENHCNRRTTKQKIQKHKAQCKIKEVPDLIKQLQELNHKDSKYLYYSKCQKHRGQALKVCSTCITVLLNINLCPFGCDIKSIQSNVKKAKGKVFYETGFIIFSPIPNFKKKENQNYYLQMISLKNIVITNKFDQMEIEQRQIYQETSEIKQEQYPVFGAVVGLPKNTYILTGGVVKNQITNNAWLFEVTKKGEDFSFKSRRLPPMNLPRSSHSLVNLNGEIYAIGGFNKKNFYLSQCQKFNINDNKWTLIAPLNYGRSKLTAFVYKSEIVVLGGLSHQAQVYSYGEILKNNKWVPVSEEALRFDEYSPLTGMAASTKIQSLSKLNNTLVFGGSNYGDYSQGIFNFNIKGQSFTLEQHSLQLEAKRAFCEIGILDTSDKNQKKIILFHGGLEHQSIINMEVVLTEIKDNKIEPIFTTQFEEAKYRDILKYQKANHFRFIRKDLETKNILNAEKLKKNEAENEHLMETLWMWGKSVSNYAFEK